MQPIVDKEMNWKEQKVFMALTIFFTLVICSQMSSKRLSKFMDKEICSTAV